MLLRILSIDFIRDSLGKKKGKYNEIEDYGTTHDLEELAINIKFHNQFVVSVFKFCSRRGTKKRENVCNEIGDHGNTRC